MHVCENPNIWLIQVPVVTGALADKCLSRPAHLDETCEFVFIHSFVNISDVLRNFFDGLNRPIILNNAVANTLCPKPNGLEIIHEMFIDDLESTRQSASSEDVTLGWLD